MNTDGFIESKTTSQVPHKAAKMTSEHTFLTVDEFFAAGAKTRLSFCQLHPTLELKFYCTSCKTVICSECGMVSHSGHQFSDLSPVVVQFKADMSTEEKAV